jgi:hypothetical protein
MKMFGLWVLVLMVAAAPASATTSATFQIRANAGCIEEFTCANAYVREHCAVRTIQYFSVGPDGIGGTGDDVSLNAVRFHYASQTLITYTPYQVFDQSPGGWHETIADNLLAAIGHSGSQDGLFAAHFTLQYDFDGLQIGYALHAATGGSAHNIVALFRNVYDEDGYLVRTLEFRDPGTDGVWGTSDDVLEAYEERIFDASDFVIAIKREDAAGLLAEIFSYVYDTSGQLVSMRRIRNQKTQEVRDYTYDEWGRLQQRIDRFYTGHGDPQPQHDSRLEYSYADAEELPWVAKLPLTVTRFLTGPDGLIGTHDDKPDVYSVQKTSCGSHSVE